VNPEAATILLWDGDLPTIPAVHSRLMSALQRDDADIAPLARLIEMDAPLAARIVRLASSPVFSPRPIRSLRDAVVRLGIAELRNVVFTCAVIGALPRACAALEISRFWKLSLGTAISARRIARDAAIPEPELAYLGGLVHALGELVFALRAPEQFRAAWARAGGGGEALAAELWSEFKLTPAELASRLLERWSFPERVIEAVRYRLEPLEAPGEALLASALLAANRVCFELGLGWSERAPEESWSERIAPQLLAALAGRGHANLGEYLEVHRELQADVANAVEVLFS
jgi:HD-like signal output (HDOD) protein